MSIDMGCERTTQASDRYVSSHAFTSSDLQLSSGRNCKHRTAAETKELVQQGCLPAAYIDPNKSHSDEAVRSSSEVKAKDAAPEAHRTAFEVSKEEDAWEWIRIQAVRLGLLSLQVINGYTDLQGNEVTQYNDGSSVTTTKEGDKITKYEPPMDEINQVVEHHDGLKETRLTDGRTQFVFPHGKRMTEWPSRQTEFDLGLGQQGKFWVNQGGIFHNLEPVGDELRLLDLLGLDDKLKQIEAMQGWVNEKRKMTPR